MTIRRRPAYRGSELQLRQQEARQVHLPCARVWRVEALPQHLCARLLTPRSAPSS